MEERNILACEAAELNLLASEAVELKLVACETAEVKLEVRRRLVESNLSVWLPT